MPLSQHIINAFFFLKLRKSKEKQCLILFFEVIPYHSVHLQLGTNVCRYWGGGVLVLLLFCFPLHMTKHDLILETGSN